MATAVERIYEWDRHPRMPAPQPPPGSCDCQFHIYEEPSKFPPRANPPYAPIESATFAQAQKMHKAIGFDRGVIVHSAIYGSDHRLLLNVLESLDDPGRYRGIGIVDDSVSNNELARLHAAGVPGDRPFRPCGIRGRLRTAGYPVGTRHAQARELVDDGFQRQSRFKDGCGLGRCDSLRQGIYRGGARPHCLGQRLAASTVAQADDERRGGSRASLPLRRW